MIMPAIIGKAPGKIILFGEHAVVYQQPAIAVPVHQICTKTYIQADPLANANQVLVDAPNIGLHKFMEELEPEHPLNQIATKVMKILDVDHIPPARIKITSTIPLAAGLGSSASTTVSFARALSTFLGHPLSDAEINRVAFDIERIHHGNPSGIDNTVITYARPLYFVKGDPIQWIKVTSPLILVIADTGISASTIKVVNDVRDHWQKDPLQYDGLFSSIGTCVKNARKAIEEGDLVSVGRLMQENQILLQHMDVSCPELDRLVKAAMQAGALGAKLSGGGRGGNMIALASSEQQAQHIADCLTANHATRTIITTIPVTGES